MAIIQRLDGTAYNLKENGIRTKDIIISSPSYQHTTETVAGRPGAVDMGSNLAPRAITGEFRAMAVDVADYPLMRDEIFNIFRSDEPFYLIEKRNPGKRWLVKTTNAYQLDQRFVYGDFTVEMICNAGMAESIGTTLSPLEWDSDLWQWGAGIPYDDYQYVHDERNFTIYNAGTEVVDPRYSDLKIKVIASALDYIEIENKTTGDVYRYNGNLTLDDTLLIDKLRSTKNGLSVFRDTNKRLIRLAPGGNEFEVRGAIIEKISFDFRFNYI
jgi:hypothetical protein